MANPTIANLRHRIMFQNLTLNPDGQGGSVESWANFYECWAQIIPKSGNEKLFANRIQDYYDHEITIRWAPNLTTTMQILFDSRIFQIKSIIRPDEKKFYLVLKCQEKVAT